MSFVFSDESEPYPEMLANLELPDKRSSCVAKVLTASSDDFFRVILFPELTRALTRYTLDDRRWVGAP